MTFSGNVDNVRVRGRSTYDNRWCSC